MGTMIAGSAVILMIVFCGYLIISNVFYISVTKDIRFFGLLKTIGTTGSQLRLFIRRQALLLCVIGIPLGLVAGYFMGALLTPAVLSVLNTNVIKIAVNPVVFIVAALFAIVTVIISISKPSKIAARVSPIEALRSTDTSQNMKKKTKKSGGINLWRMAQGNVFRNKTKVVLVTISLSLSLIILNTAYSMANSFDMDKYLSGMIGSDFAVGDVSNFNVHISYTDQNTVSPSFLKEIFAKNGVEEVSNIYFAEPLIAVDPRLKDLPARLEKELGLSGEWLTYIQQEAQASQLLQHIYGVDDKVWERFTVFDGTIDLQKLKTGKYIIAAPYDNNGRTRYYNVGDKVEIASVSGTVNEYEVLAVALIPYNISNQHSHPITPEFYLPSDLFLQNVAEKTPMLTTLNVADDGQAEMERFLADYCENVDSNMAYRSKATFVAEYENTQRTYKSVGLVLSLLVAFIGIMNFINTVVTSIMARKRELAMLQSIGMTNRQSRIMLICEGLVYMVLTAAFVLSIGSIIGYFSLRTLVQGGLYLSLHFTVLPSLLCLPVLAVICMIVPCISQSVANKSSMVERLREVE